MFYMNKLRHLFNWRLRGSCLGTWLYIKPSPRISFLGFPVWGPPFTVMSDPVHQYLKLTVLCLLEQAGLKTQTKLGIHSIKCQKISSVTEFQTSNITYMRVNTGSSGGGFFR
jgi:hypothetical protein